MQPQNSTILVYMILNGKRSLTSYGLYGYSHASIHLLTGRSIRVVCFQIKTFMLLFQVFWFIRFVVSV